MRAMYRARDDSRFIVVLVHFEVFLFQLLNFTIMDRAGGDSDLPMKRGTNVINNQHLF